jgi:2-succinyl-5-enolpyruvyl-6-hydroxy-3-cyclohexene-1-carboxylate synthase
MKKSINRNILWSQIFAVQLEKCGLKNVCFSPGSRSTPLTFAFSSSKNINTHVILDERSSGFFALGLAKKLREPVAVVTTSGTAVAELYPAIVEAFQSRIPLIICTADRPPQLRFSGANQTINQDNIFVNHIRKFTDLGLPSLDIRKLNKLKKTVLEGYFTADKFNPGPVHFNLPFDKPFEPDAYTDTADVEFLKSIKIPISYSYAKKNINIELKKEKLFKKILTELNTSSRGIIFCGPGFYSKEFAVECGRLSKKLGFPILADGASNFRFFSHSNNNLIKNFPNIFRSKEIRNNFQADIIIQFGKAPTSQSMLNYFEESNGKYFLVNEFGDNHDPSLSVNEIIKIEPSEFCRHLLIKLEGDKSLSKNLNYSKSLTELDITVESLKEKFLKKAGFPFEGKIVYEIVNEISSILNLMVSNSLSIRDLDFFVSKSAAKINLYCNRGASGIDGITSTAMGIAKESDEPTVLVTGDLAFLHDLNGLALSQLLAIPLTIILINNNGGGVFEMLPIAKHETVFNKYFKTPHNFSFKNFVKGFGGNYFYINSWKELRSKLNSSLNNRRLNILEIKTDSAKSLKIRMEFWELINSESINFINEFNKVKN